MHTKATEITKPVRTSTAEVVTDLAGVALVIVLGAIIAGLWWIATP